MSLADKEKWERKYRQKPQLLQPRPPCGLLERHIDHFNKGQALDLACGNGRNTLYLAQKGFKVDAIDISQTALGNLKIHSKGLDVTLIEADLDSYSPPRNHYDLLVMTNYLDRALIGRCIAQMKSGACFVIETYMAHPENEKKDANPDFLLAPEELKHFFDKGFDLLAYEEFRNEPHELYRMHKQGIVAQKH